MLRAHAVPPERGDRPLGSVAMMAALRALTTDALGAPLLSSPEVSL